jgi:hypothetical protein
MFHMGAAGSSGDVSVGGVVSGYAIGGGGGEFDDYGRRGGKSAGESKVQAEPEIASTIVPWDEMFWLSMVLPWIVTITIYLCSALLYCVCVYVYVRVCVYISVCVCVFLCAAAFLLPFAVCLLLSAPCSIYALTL